MYRPQERSEKVVVLCYDENEDDSYYTIGIVSGTEPQSERYPITCILQDGQDELQRIHKEDIYKDTEQNREKIPQDIRLFYLSG